MIYITLQILLKTSDNVVFTCELDVARMSSTIRDWLDIYGIEKSLKTVIPLPGVHSLILKKVLIYCYNHLQDSFHLESEEKQKTLERLPANQHSMITWGEVDLRRRDQTASWDMQLFTMDRDDDFFGLLNAASYLGLPGMIRCGVIILSNVLKDFGPRTIQSLYRMRGDLDTSLAESIYDDYELVLRKHHKK